MTLACPKCGSNAIRPSQRKLKDGLTRLVVYSPLRCNVCGHRYFRFSLWGVAGAAAVLLLIGLSAGIGYIVSSHYADLTRPSVSRQ